MKKSAGTIAMILTAVLAVIGFENRVGAADGAAAAGGFDFKSILFYVGIMAVFFVAMYFIAIRPEKKREKEQKALLSTMAVGDTVLTTAGFYGVVIDITNDTVIVEFGNNKNCRIPMQKASIVQLEHPEGYVAPVAETKDEKKSK